MEIGLQQQQLDLRLRIEDSADFIYLFLFIYFYMSFTARRSLRMATIINFFLQHPMVNLRLSFTPPACHCSGKYLLVESFLLPPDGSPVSGPRNCDARADSCLPLRPVPAPLPGTGISASPTPSPPCLLPPAPARSPPPCPPRALRLPLRRASTGCGASLRGSYACTETRLHRSCSRPSGWQIGRAHV